MPVSYLFEILALNDSGQDYVFCLYCNVYHMRLLTQVSDNGFVITLKLNKKQLSRF